MFPEKGTYEWGDRHRSGIYKMEAIENDRLLSISINWVTLENQAFESRYTILPDGQEHTFENPEVAETLKAIFTDGITFETVFYRQHEQVLQKQRKELSLLIYSAKLNFTPVMGHTYYVYEKADGSHLLSMVSPKEWGGGAGPYKRFVAAVKLLADHTWMEMV